MRSSTGIFEAAAPTGYGPTSIEQFKKFRLAAYSGSSGVSWLRTQYDMPLQLLLAMTGLVLLIACANLANLMLARATARQHEVAVRLALGASRATLLRQFLVESGLLAASGAALGIGLAQILSRVLVRALSTADAAPTLTIATDWRVLLFTAGLAMATCLVFGIAPALRAARILPASAMKSGGRSMTAGRERFSVQRLMVVTQIAVSLVLLVAALLFVRSFRNLITFDPGFRQEGITVGFFSFHRSGLAPEGINDFQRAFLAEIKAMPGIVNAGTTTNIPLIGGSWTHGVRVGANQGDSKFTWVSPGYFETMNLPILQGRDFTLHDTRTSLRVAVVNQTFVRQLAGGANPIGLTLRTAPEPNYPSTVYEIVGVVPDTKYNDLRGEIPAMAFAPDSQYPTIGPWSVMMIQSSIDPAAAIAGIKHRLAESHPEVLAEFNVFQIAHSRRSPARATPGDAGRVLRRAGGGARRGRTLRHDLVCRRATASGDRDSRRARRASSAGHRDDDARSRLAARGRARRGRRAVAARRTNRVYAALRAEAARSAHARGGVPVAGRRRRRGQLRARAKRVEARSAGCPAPRVKQA